MMGPKGGRGPRGPRPKLKNPKATLKRLLKYVFSVYAGKLALVAVLIMVSVGLDTVKQIESQLMQRNYEGFLK